MLALPPRHRLLLRAAVGEPPVAKEAWQQWRATNSIRRADTQESAVLALLASRADILDVTGDDTTRLRGLRRHAVVRGFVVGDEAGAAAAALRVAGVDPIAIKGVALAAAYGSDRVRAVGDADLLVPPGTGRVAVDVLLEHGFELGIGLRPADLPVWMERYHAVPVRRPGQPEVDVHWRLPHQPAWTAPVVGRIVDAARPCPEFGWAIPHPAHQVAITVAHGWPTTAGALLRMLIDLAVLVEGGDVDPPRIDEIIGPLRLRAALRDALDVLADEGLAGASPLLGRLRPVRVGDRVWARHLTTDRDGVGSRAATAFAHRRPAALRPPATRRLDITNVPDPALGVAASLCGHGWWLGDGWATWSRRRLALLRVAGESEHGAVVHLGLAPVPGMRVPALVIGGRRLRLVRFPDDGTVTVPVRVRAGRRSVIAVCSPWPTVADQVLHNGDHRRLGVALTALCWTPRE